MIKKVYKELAIEMFVYIEDCVATSQGPFGFALDGFNGENCKIGL